MRAFRILLITCALAACESRPEVAQEEPTAACDILLERTPLARAIRETSGIELGRRTQGVLWTHNDSGWDAEIFALSQNGEISGTLRVQGATNRDWEDLAIGPCPSGNCLYIGEIGDNEGVHDTVFVYRMPEPLPTDSVTGPVERFPMIYPERPRDAESLFILPMGELYLLTKGRTGPAGLFRYPPPLRAEVPVRLELVAEFGGAGREHRDLVTGAGTSPDGRWTAIRTYRELTIHPTQALLSGDPKPVVTQDLAAVGEPQGEAVAIDDDGRVVLTSESGFADAPGFLTILQCRLPG